MKLRAIALFTVDGELQAVAMRALLDSPRGLRVASTLDEALRILQRDSSDLDMVIVDLDSDAGELALANALRGCSERLPVVAVTSLQPSQATAILTRKGAAAYLRKPLTPNRLSAVIDQFTTPHQPLRQATIAPIDRLGPGLWTDFAEELSLSACRLRPGRLSAES